MDYAIELYALGHAEAVRAEAARAVAAGRLAGSLLARRRHVIQLPCAVEVRHCRSTGAL